VRDPDLAGNLPVPICIGTKRLPREPGRGAAGSGGHAPGQRNRSRGARTILSAARLPRFTAAGQARSAKSETRIVNFPDKFQQELFQRRAELTLGIRRLGLGLGLRLGD
jgi:hypothetical protein